MATRRDFNNIALGVVRSFVSRNNDVDGYWAIGKLCSYLLQNNLNSAKIDLLRREIYPTHNAFNQMLLMYSEKLFALSLKRGLESKTITSAEIELHLAPGEHSLSIQPGAGKYCLECIITIIDDRGRSYVRRTRPWCNAHDPASERRSTRVLS